MFKKHFGKFNENKKKAIILILLFGIISLLGDIIYEGARSVNGPFLNTLGANAVIIGLVVGIGELLGYAIRLFSGYFSDKAKAHWFFTILGYSLLITVPLLALSNYWQLAAVFIVLERIGKGLRSPARDTLVSHATKQVGTGFGFGISEFIDQIGATVGPLIFTLFFIYLGVAQKTAADYQRGYSLLWFPFVILIIILLITFFKFKTPSDLEKTKNKIESSKISKVFWVYSFFAFVTTVGFINFAIVGYHLKINGIASDAQIPFLYAIAMSVDAIFGIILGKIYDNMKIKHKNENAGLLILFFVPILTAILLPFIFSYNIALILIAVFFWGVVMGSHETIMKAAIADLTSISKRGTGYGIFNVIYGLALFFGSVFSGYLYEISITLMIASLVCIEILSIALFFVLKKSIKNSNSLK
ncbi:MAG: MFS transporter [Candidatus Aenigmatarchaeota archaeon]|nr:MFS transporter [Candidatus Aenigmarchaeota archaeon]